MKIEIVAIADEILRGMIVNTNSSTISEALCRLGWKVQQHTVLSDQRDLLEKGLREALERADLVISTGGLGPTLDDVTKDVAATIFGSELCYKEEIANELISRFGKTLPSLENQATVPIKAHVLSNKVGTAPGLVFHEKGKMLILLPGVPPEMVPMLHYEVIPYLQQVYAGHKKANTEIMHFGLLNENMVDPTLRELQKKHKDLEMGIYPGYGVLSVSLHSSHKETIQSSKEELLKQFGPYHFVSETGKIEEALHHWMLDHKKTLAFAESCTGGMLSHKVTSLSRASEYFCGSIVCYSNEMKKKLLSVSESTLKAHGAVSKECVEEMLNGLFAITTADYGIAVSGIAGPTGGSPEKPVGTIWAAIGERGKKPDVGSFLAFGSRQTIINSSSTRLLAALYRKLEHKKPAFPF